MKSLFPVFVTENLIRAKEFYVKYLGFKIVFEVEWYVQLHSERVDEAPLELAFMLPNLEDQHPSVRPRFSGDGVILTLDFEDVDAIYQELIAREAGREFVIDIKDEPWGQRHFIFRDPAGILVDAVQMIAPSPEYDQGYSSQEK